MPTNPNFLYGTTQGGDLIEFDPATGTETVIQTGLQTYGDMAMLPDGTLLGFGFSGGIAGEIYTIDPDTGTETLLVDTGETGTSSGLGTDSDGNIYYSSDNNTEISRLVFDSGSGTYGPPQVIETGLTDVWDIAFDGNDTMYYIHGVAGNDQSLSVAILDPVTGAISSTTQLLTPLPDTDIYGFAQGLDGTLYMVEGSGAVYEVDVDLGAGTATTTLIDGIDPENRTGNDRIFGLTGAGVCFAKGTMIETRNGPVAIEDLRVGDELRTLHNGFQPLKWVGHRKIKALGKMAPIVFQKSSIGNGEELVLSPLHKVLASDWKAELICGEAEILVEARFLVNGDTIYQKPGGFIEYYHVMLDAHEIIFANGAQAESLYLGSNTKDVMTHEQLEEIYTIFPELGTAKGMKGYLPSHPSMTRNEGMIYSQS